METDKIKVNPAEVRARLGSLEKCCSRMGGLIRTAKTQILQVQDTAGLHSPGESFLFENLLKSDAEISGILEMMYSLLSPPIITFPRLPDREITAKYLDAVRIPAEKVSAFFSADRLYVRCPLLRAKRYSFVYSKSGNTNFLTLNSKFFCEAIAKKTREILFRDELDKTALFQHKTIQFLFIYSLSSAAKMLDNDNHDIKTILDSVCAGIASTDNPTTTSILLESIESDAVSEGTYITISPGIHSFIEPTAVINAWIGQPELSKNVL